MPNDSTRGDNIPVEISSRNAHSDCAYHCFTIQQQTKSIIKRTVSKTRRENRKSHNDLRKHSAFELTKCAMWRWIFKAVGDDVHQKLKFIFRAGNQRGRVNNRAIKLQMSPGRENEFAYHKLRHDKKANPVRKHRVGRFEWIHYQVE